ncbi:AbgT family transporter [Brevundimonas sp.]|uniref:AbgT family transporter n=1 Tax=Brevundimonas sp. TaxID=1871086 RepID=UPI0039194FEB
MGIGNWLLNGIEKAGNKLPDPVFIFVWLIAILMGVSVFAAYSGWAAVNPITAEPIIAENLLSSDNLRRLLVEMPRTLTGFAPLGYVLVVMLGAGVAERTGLFSAAMRAGVRRAPTALLTPIVIFIAILSSHAVDAGYVVLVPLAGVLYAAAGRHPIVGISAAFAGVSAAFSSNIVPGQLDVLLLGITETAAHLIDPSWQMNPAGNWFFIIAMTFMFVPLGWWVTDKIIEPRLGKWTPSADSPIKLEEGELGPRERKGLIWAGLVLLLVIAAWAAMLLAPGAPLYDPEGADPAARMAPFFNSLVAAFFTLFIATGAAYGVAAGTVTTHRDIVRMTSQAMADMAPYVVLAFVAAHFVAMFNWSNLGAIMAIGGAEVISQSGLNTFGLLVALVLVSGFINLFVGSAAAKWAMLAPVLVPMLMLLGISPEMTTAAYRMGDSVTNIITPLMVYFPLVLAFCQRWDKDFGLGSLMALMVPYSLVFMIFGTLMTGAWAAMALPLGPGVGVHYDIPTPAEASQVVNPMGPAAPESDAR